MTNSSPVAAASPKPLEQRKAAIIAALRAVRDEPREVVRPWADDVHRLSSRLDHLEDALAMVADKVVGVVDKVGRVEDKVDLLHEGDEAPLSWPAPLTTDSTLEVPPVEVSRANSPAFDILLGPAKQEPRRETA